MALEVVANESFGQRLRRIRKERKLTQLKLAEMVGIPSHYICTYEKEKVIPSITTIEWLCKALGITATELLGF